MDQNSPDYLQMLAKSLQDPEAFKAQFGDAFKSYDTEDAIAQQRMALARQLMGQTENQYAQGPGANATGAALGGFANAIRSVTGGLMMNGAEQAMRDVAPGKAAAGAAGQRLKLALEAYKNDNEREMQKLKNEPDIARTTEEKRYHDAYLQMERDKYGKEKDGAAAKAAADRAEQLQKTAAELRGEFNGNPTIKPMQEVASAYRTIQSTAAKPSPAGDISLVTAFMKMIDPTSSVREGEFANAQNAAGVPSQLVNVYNKMLKGTRLSEDQRKDFVSQAGGLFQARYTAFKPYVDRYTALANRSGVSPEDVVSDFGFGDLLKPQTSAAPKVTPSGKPYVRAQKNTATGAVRYLDAVGQVVE
jgi:hypothetical protein